jgi:hypothetical protein
MLQTLSDGLFAADLAGNVNSYRQNVQIEYVGMLEAALGQQSNTVTTSRRLSTLSSASYRILWPEKLVPRGMLC